MPRVQDAGWCRCLSGKQACQAGITDSDHHAILAGRDYCERFCVGVALDYQLGLTQPIPTQLLHLQTLPMCVSTERLTFGLT